MSDTFTEGTAALHRITSWLLPLVLVSACGASSTRETTSSINAAPAAAPATADPTPAAASALPSENGAVAEPPEWFLPRERTDVVSRAACPALAAGDRAYDAAMAVLLAAPGATDVSTWLTTTTSSLDLRTERVEEAERLYARDAHDDAEHLAAYVRVGDLFDAIGAELARAPAPPDPGGMSDDARTELGEDMRDFTIREAALIYCRALGAYRHALALAPDEPRALAQVIAYGPEFEALCIERSGAGR